MGHLEQICKVTVIDDEMYCVLDDDKVLTFLDKKLKSIQHTLQSDASIQINADPLQYALAIINEYISVYYFDKICEKYNVSAKRVINPRKRKKADTAVENQDEIASKRRKMNDANENSSMPKINVEDLPWNDRNNPTQQKKQVKLTPSRAVSNLKKVNTKGMKSMMNYFSQKKKK